MLSCECQINNFKLIYILHDHGPAPTIDFHAMICVINRPRNGHCFLEHRCHDIIKKANSTFLSADRSSLFFFKYTYPSLRGSVYSQNCVYNFPFDKMRGDKSTGSNMQHVTLDGQITLARKARGNVISKGFSTRIQLFQFGKKEFYI